MLRCWSYSGVLFFSRQFWFYIQVIARYFADRVTYMRSLFLLCSLSNVVESILYICDVIKVFSCCMSKIYANYRGCELCPCSSTPLGFLIEVAIANVLPQGWLCVYLTRTIVYARSCTLYWERAFRVSSGMSPAYPLRVCFYSCEPALLNRSRGGLYFSQYLKTEALLPSAFGYPTALYWRKFLD